MNLDFVLLSNVVASCIISGIAEAKEKSDAASDRADNAVAYCDDRIGEVSAALEAIVGTI